MILLINLQNLLIVTNAYHLDEINSHTKIVKFMKKRVMPKLREKKSNLLKTNEDRDLQLFAEYQLFIFKLNFFVHMTVS